VPDLDQCGEPTGLSSAATGQDPFRSDTRTETLLDEALGASKLADIGGHFLNLGVACLHNAERPQFATQTGLQLSAPAS
jgi:hypothetical protein